MFRVFKTSAGEFRWVGVSSSAFEDRTGETVSTKAIDYSIKAAKGDYGELRLYHLPGTRVGICDNSMRAGMFLIESGTFDDADMADQVRSTVNTNPEKYGLSIGFKYRSSDLVDDCYEKIKIFERSIVEEEDAAALFTNIRLMSSSAEVISMEKQEELISKLTEMLNGDEDLAKNLFEQASKIGVKMQAGEELGLKDTETVAEVTEEVTKPVVKETVTEDVAEDVTEPVTEPVVEPDAEGEVEDNTEESTDVTTNFVLELDLPTIKILADEVAQRVPAPDQSGVEDVQKQLKAMASQLDSVGAILNHLLKTDEDKLADMQKQLPRARLSYRPSSVQETITESPKEVVEEKQVLPKNPSRQSLADSIESIQTHRNNLRIVG